MTFLRLFLSRCTEQEIYKLKLLDLRGNEHEALLENIKHCKDAKVSDEQIQQQLKLSKSYFDKINSVLLNKCTTALTLNGTYEEVFGLFLEKDLPELLKHEVKVREKKIVKSSDAEEIIRFYYFSFQTLRRMPVSEYDDSLTEQYMLKYLKSKKNVTLEDQVEANAMLEAQRAFVKAASGAMKDYEAVFLKKMKKLQQQIKDKPLPRAHFHCHLAWANYYDFYTNDFNGLVSALKQALEFYEKGKSQIADSYRMYAITKLAKAYCQGSYFEEAMKIYREAFDLFGKQLSKNPYHPTMYAVVAIINGKYSEAEKMMNENLLHLLNPEKPGTIDFDIYRTYAILYMNQSKFDKAFQYLEKALTFKRSEISLLGDILLRMVHNSFFVLNNDLETAKSTLARNFKFLSSKGNDAMVKEYLGYFNMLKQIIRYREGKKLPKDFAQQLEPYRKGIMKLYGDLLDKMID